MRVSVPLPKFPFCNRFSEAGLISNLEQLETVTSNPSSVINEEEISKLISVMQVFTSQFLLMETMSYEEASKFMTNSVNLLNNIMALNESLIGNGQVSDGYDSL